MATELTDNNSEDLNDGFFIQVCKGDVVDTGSGPPYTMHEGTGIWVPKGSTVNGITIVTSTDA